MTEKDDLLTENEVQQIAKKFLLAKYYSSKIEFSNSELITIDNTQLYQLHVKITMHSNSAVGHFILHKSADKHNLIIEIDAHQGKIIHYEFV